MNWLITVKRGTPIAKIDKLLKKAGGSRSVKISDISQVDQTGVPIGDDEIVIAVEGPSEIQKLESQSEAIVKVSPNSEIDLFERF